MNETGLFELLKLFENDISVSDITASKLLGRISSAIAKKRIDLGMTQKEFAKYMNVSQGMVSKWESKDYNFSIKTLAEIAEKLDMELSVNVIPRRSKIQLRRMDDVDVSYVISNQKEFTGKSCRVDEYKSKVQMIKNVKECKVYCFNEKLEM